MRKIFPIIVTTLALIAGPVLAQTPRSGFNPDILMPDSRFNDAQALGGPEGVQKFLESKGSLLADTSPTFLAKLGEPGDAAVKLALGDPEWNLGRPRTAAELIWDAAQASGLSPQVILVTLNKEQGLVAMTQCLDESELRRRLNRAMGFACPDGSACGNLFPGFYYQLFGNVDTEGNKYLGAAKSLMRSFSTPGGRGPNLNGAPAKVGDQVTLDNTLGGFEGVVARQIVTLGNLATAALYRYTPHVFNGNYNFWNFFTSWFKYANGTLLAATDGRTYVVEDGLIQYVPGFVVNLRNLNLASAIQITPAELAEWQSGPAYAPPDGTVVMAGGRLFAFEGGIRRPVSGFVLSQRGLNHEQPLAIGADDLNLFPAGAQLPPTDGTVLRGLANPDVYLVQGGVLKKFSEFTFKQRKAEKEMQLVTDAEVELYAKQGWVPPLAGTLIKLKGDSGLYVMGDGIRRPLTPDLFQNLGYKTKDVVAIESAEEIASFPLGAPATPKEGTWFTTGTELFLFKNGAKHPIYPFVAKQRGITPDWTFDASLASAWPDGIALAPKNGTLVRSDADVKTYYLVQAGQLRGLTPTLVKNLGLNLKKAVTLPDWQVSQFAQGGFATPKENTWYKAGDTFAVFKGGATHAISTFVAKQRSLTPDWTFDATTVAAWPAGDPIPPRDGTLVKGDADPTIYLFSQAKLRPLTAAAFKSRGYLAKNVKTLPQAEVDGYVKGAEIKK